MGVVSLRKLRSCFWVVVMPLCVCCSCSTIKSGATAAGRGSNQERESGRERKREREKHKEAVGQRMGGTGKRERKKEIILEAG